MDAVNKERVGNDLTQVIGGYVDVRDLAAIHAEALTSAAVAGRRILACAGSFTYQTLCEFRHSITPLPVLK